jgi:mono/diheme cytochrome c family protein
MTRRPRAWRYEWLALAFIWTVAAMSPSEAHDSSERREREPSPDSEEPVAALNPKLVEKGARIYQQYCASCHGAQGEGAPNWREPNALGELPAPPHGPEGHTWRHSDAMLYRMVSEGWRDPFNETEHLTMPAFEDVLAPREIKAVITYLKTLWTPEQRAFQEAETEARGGFPPEARAGGAE